MPPIILVKIYNKKSLKSYICGCGNEGMGAQHFSYWWVSLITVLCKYLLWCCEQITETREWFHLNKITSALFLTHYPVAFYLWNYKMKQCIKISKCIYVICAYVAFLKIQIWRLPLRSTISRDATNHHPPFPPLGSLNSSFFFTWLPPLTLFTVTPLALGEIWQAFPPVQNTH